MLPVIGTDPIRFNLLKQQRSSSRLLRNHRESTDCISQSEHHHQQHPPGITLYPITVEFDRLLRRQQQLKQCCWSPPLVPSLTSTSKALKLASSGRAASLSSTPAKTASKSQNGHHSNSNRTSLYESVNGSTSKSMIDPATLLSNLDAHELLYATICHYYASLCKEQQKSELTGLDRDKYTKNTSAETTAKQQSLEQLYRTLCTPGTRTMLLLADRAEIVANLKRENQVEQSKREKVNQFDGNQQEVEDEEVETKNQQLTSSSHYEADVEADENSDLESEHSLRRHSHHQHHKPSSSTLQQNRHHDFCCPSSGINSSMSEDCLTASLRGDEQQAQPYPPPAPAPSPAPEAKRASITVDGNHQKTVSRSARICRLMSGGEMILASTECKARSDHHHHHNHHLPNGIKMGLRGHRSAAAIHQSQSSIPKEKESPILSRKFGSSKLRHFLSGFDHFLDAALERQTTFWRRWKRMLSEEDQKEEERLLDCLGIEQQIVGCVTFYKSYRLTGIKVIELALICVHPKYQGAGIGSHLLRAVKQSGQIGPYDAIRVKVPNSQVEVLDFFLCNDFSDDMILNASFDQLDNVCSDEGEDDSAGCGGDSRENPLLFFAGEVGQSSKLVHNGIEQRESPSPSPSPTLGHSISFDGFGNGSSTTTTAAADHHRWSSRFGGGGGSRISKSKSTILFSGVSAATTSGSSTSSKSSPKQWWTSLCYLPPFSVATSLSCDYGTTLNSHHHHHRPPSSSTSLIGQLDNRYVDELIEEANGVWRRDLLAAYRTQWSCVGRLRAEISRLRGVIVDAEHSIETLQRENLQLRTRLLQSETTAQLNAQKHLFLLKNFNFDSLDF